RDGNGGKGTGDPPDDADTWDTTNEYEDGVSEDIPDYMHGSPTPRLVELFRGIRAADPDRVWDAFNDIANSGEWDQLAENEITQAIRVYNNQFSFERSSQALDRVKSIFSICSQRQFVFENTWSYNEMIRFHISEGRRDLAYKVKDRMESGQFGPNVVVDVHTYAPFFNDPYISSRKDIGQLVDLYDEMIFKRIKPDPRIEKALILHARKSGETQLLSKLLESTSTDGIPHRLGSLAARVISARTKAYTSMHKPRLAREELMKLLSYQIPKDTRPIPASYMKSSEPGQVNIPLSHSLTRDAFFIYLRSAYESLIRIRLVRRNPHVARELLDDMRRISYVPPSVAIYEQFIRYHAKRKDIHQLRGIYEMMQQDGVKVTEHFYTKFITSCMFKPKRRLLAFLTSKAIKISQEAADKLKGIENTCIDSTDGDSGADKAYIDNTDEDNGDDLEETDAQDGQNYSEVVLDAKAQEELSRLAFHPNECIRFFEDMLDDYGVDVSVIQDRGYIPNVQITNSVMRAYIQLERYKLALREFVPISDV
ncbi:hypothetical protein EV175_004768, partial [Coemansia sp. RSA 1933]